MANLMDESNETRLNQSEILLKQISTIRGIVSALVMYQLGSPNLKRKYWT